ncbi:hypothetical protein LCGC14_3051350 [marine sediment metagenome]|uniref:Uncharacterized protein n=1 Tax=marine sediment metagenome TaxID=412755 RepID=A0A0F8X9S7_9ZZZZ
MSYKYKKKSVHLEDQVHRKLKIIAMDDDTSIEKIANKYLKEKIKEVELKNEK